MNWCAQMYERMLGQTRWLIRSLSLIGAVVSALLAIGQFCQMSPWGR